MYNERKKGSAPLPVKRRSTLPISRSKHNDDTPILRKLLISSLIGLGVCVLSGILLVTASCAFAYAASDPLAMISPLALLALLPSNFLGGFISARRCGSNALSCGLVTAVFQCTVSLVLSLCMYSVASSEYTLLQGILLHAVSVLFCILGALAGGIKRKPSHKKRRFG